MSLDGDIAVDMQHVDVLFGAKNRQAAALAQLDAGGTRDEILEATGVVIGVADANLTVPAGSISVLMGLSGSGKSSLLRCVNGLNTVTRGVLNVHTDEGPVNVAGLKGNPLRALRRSHLAMVFQQFALLPWATVRENIGFGLSVRGESDAHIREAVDRQLELVNLEAWAEKPIHTLSGGMQQRVGLARAFATDAEILLMDEPFSALDPLIREHLQDELLTLQKRLKKTILFVSHDLDEALKLGNVISIMEGGRIVQTGTADDIVFSPASDYVKRFVANINPLSVLTAAKIMHPLDASGQQCVVPDLQMEIDLSDGCPLALRIEGDALPLHVHSSETINAGDGVACISAGTPVRELLQQMSRSARPVLVMDDQKLCGVVRSSDVIAALAGNSTSTDEATR